MLTSEQFDKWLAELRNPENKQTSGRLASRNWFTDERGFCCLGLLCEKVLDFDLSTPNPSGHGDSWERSTGEDEDAPGPLMKAVGELDRHTLAVMNDEGRTFQEIADHLENHREEFVSVDE